MKILKTVVFILVSLSVMHQSYSQVGINTTTPDASSVLDISSTTQGVLTPRMTSVQRVAIASPAQGLLVFDTDDTSFYFYNGTIWIPISSGNSNDYTGWADYVDGTYTSASPFVLTAANKVTLPNDAATVRDSQKPIDVTTFYDTTNSTITGRNGDAVNIVIEFKARPTTAAITRLTVAIDIGAPVGEIYVRDFVLAKGNGVEHFYLSSFNAYTLGTFEANGGQLKLNQLRLPTFMT
ncbi:hypothetical protein [Lacinutrix sp. Hel_I_90]|uniref:hypothetical protein n=1 Tax=Lacinutrix sp. Hel_I_90 TaxID=1249999 RepID=UPI0005C9A2DD|nr:hypothetical protein [Lacinutrix sp. Hel_I_90]